MWTAGNCNNDCYTIPEDLFATTASIIFLFLSLPILALWVIGCLFVRHFQQRIKVIGRNDINVYLDNLRSLNPTLVLVLSCKRNAGDSEDEFLNTKETIYTNHSFDKTDSLPHFSSKAVVALFISSEPGDDLAKELIARKRAEMEETYEKEIKESSSWSITEEIYLGDIGTDSTICTSTPAWSNPCFQYLLAFFWFASY